MATAITPSLRASLERLKHGGTVNGICLSWKRQVLVSLMPYEDFRVEQLVHVLNDARDHYQSSPGGRAIDSFWMAYLDVHLLAVFSGDCAVIILHVRPEESDFLAASAKTFLHDTQLLVAAALSPSPEGSGEIAGDGGWLPQPPHLDPHQTNMMV